MYAGVAYNIISFLGGKMLNNRFWKSLLCGLTMLLVLTFKLPDYYYANFRMLDRDWYDYRVKQLIDVSDLPEPEIGCPIWAEQLKKREDLASSWLWGLLPRPKKRIKCSQEAYDFYWNVSNEKWRGKFRGGFYIPPKPKGAGPDYWEPNEFWEFGPKTNKK